MKSILLIFPILLLLHPLRMSAQNTNVQVTKIVEREMQERRIPGLQLAVVYKGKIAFSQSFGKANLQENIPVDARTIFPINSCTKVFTSIAIIQLVEQGKLDLSKSVGDYLKNLPSSWKGVTIKQLLTHISGLPNLLSLLDPRTGGMGSYKDEAALWEKLITLPIEFSPGLRFNYNQTNAYLLGKLIDELSGKPFADFISEKQLKVVGMPGTLFGDSRDVIPHYAPTYYYRRGSDGKKFEQAKLMNNYYEFPYFRRTASGLNSTAEDIANWLTALQGGRLISSKTLLDTMWTPAKFSNGQPTPWALGWGMNKFRPRHQAVGMSGGSRAAFLLYPKDDLAVIVLTNLGESYPEDFLEEIAGCYIPDIITADPVTFLRVNLKKMGFSNAIPLAERQMKADPQFRPNEFELNEWAYRMMTQGQLEEAIEIFKLEVHLYPKSSNAHDSYGEALLKKGKKQEAIQIYKRALALDPANAHSKKMLEGLLEK